MLVTHMRVLCCDRRGHLGAMWRENCPTHTPIHGHPLNVKCSSKPILNSKFTTFIMSSSYCRELGALDSITMAIKPAASTHLASNQLSLLLCIHASYSSFRPLVHGPSQPCLSLPRTLSGGGISSPLLQSTPSLSYTLFPSRVMQWCHRM